MADEIQLKVSADIKEVNSAITATKKFEKQITNTVKALNEGKITNKAYNQSLLEIKRGYQEYSTSSQKATADVRNMARAVQEETKISKALADQKKIELAQKREEIKLYKQARTDAEQMNRIKDQAVKKEKAAADAVARNTAELRRFKSSYDAVYSAEQKRLSLKKLLRAEVAAGNMTLRQAGTELLNYRNNLNQVNGALGNTRNRMNAGGMAMQQVGYQVGDFLVQAQSGTNLFVAFGQQATQLVGILPMVATQLGITMSAAIGLSAGLGIIIPLATALGAAFMMSKSSADDLTTTLDKLEDAYAKIESINDTLEVQLVGTWAAASEGADNYLRKLREVTQESARAAGEDVLNRDASILAQFKADLLGGDDTSGIVSQMDESIQDLLDKRQSLVNRMTDRLIGQKNRDKRFDELSPEADRLLKVANRYKDERQAFLNVFAKGTTTEESVIRILALREKYEKSGGDAMLKRIDGIITELKLEGEITAYRKKLADDQEATTKNQLDHIDELLKAGIDAANAQTKLDNLKTKNQLANVDALLKAGIAAADAQTKADDLKTKNQLAHVEDLLKSGIKAADQEIKADNQKTADQLANIDDLLKAGIKSHEARLKMIQDEAKELNYFNNIMLAWQRQIGQGQKERDKVVKGPKPKTMEGPIKALERQIELSKALFGLEGDARREQEVYMQLKFQNQDADIKAKESQLRSLAALVVEEERRTRVLEEQKELQKEVADSIANSMGDALMSMVDGTKSVKDAFRDMANDIIKELYRIYVVKQITGMISSGIDSFMGFNASASANGNVFSNGNLVPYADGGIVGSPTTFPMTGGRTGLMGEAGPEAIMPLKRGKNGKLGVETSGGSGDITIHQNFNFTANGDESVKQIIAQQAPAIANMTKRSILDDRRRGGQMKQAFG